MTTEMIVLPVAAERRPDLLALLGDAEGSVFSPPACLGIRAMLREDDGAVMVLVEWDSRAAHDETAASAPMQSLLDRVAELTDGPPRIEFFEPT